jgi:hypothetical protein
MLYGPLATAHLLLVAVDMNDCVVPAQRTFDLQKLCNNSRMVRHNEGELDAVRYSGLRLTFLFGAGHSIPIRSDWPDLMKDFIVEACQSTG